MSARHSKYRFPWRDGNRFRLLNDGGRFYPAMLAAIAEARQYILLEMYLFESGKVADRFIDALTAATGRGVTVSVLLDDLGSYLLRNKDRHRLTEAGVDLVFYNPLRARGHVRNLLRDHRKLLVVDGDIAFTGGAGITDAFDPDVRPDSFWHDIMLEIRGPNVADWQALFVEARQRWAARPLYLPQQEIRPVGFQAGRVAVHSIGPRKSEIIRSFINRIRNAERSVWLVTAYFLPSWKIRRALIRSASAGVDVRLLVPGPLTDHPSVRHLGCRYYEQLLRAGVRIFEYQPKFLHAKALICDNWLSIGSCNLDRWSYRWSLEANQELEDPRLISRMRGVFQFDLSQCLEIRYEEWLQRPWYRRRLEGLLGWIEGLLRRLGEAKSRPGNPPPT
jgi:cardiolipin synthase A/B